MAHKILGIELGAYSVKVVVATAGFRSVTINDYLERPVPPGPESHEERAARALGDLLREKGLSNEIPCAAYPGDAISIRVLDFGFSGLKRADLEKAVGAELEGLIPHDLDEIVYDFDTIPQDAEVKQAAAEDAAAAEPAFAGGEGKQVTPRPAAPVVGTRVLAAAAPTDRVRYWMGLGAGQGLEPRGILAAPTVYARVAGKLAALGGADAKDDGVLVIDHGHGRTNVCVVKHERAIFARTLSRGGRHVTQAIAKAWNLSFEDAERAKHADGFIASAREPAPSDAWARISEVITRELVPMVRDLRQTISACRAQTGILPRRAVLCGGGGRLRGLGAYLSEELGLPVGEVTADDAPRLIGPLAAGRGVRPDSALLAHGVALEGATGRPLFDLRQRELSYRADFSFLRAKAGFLAACALLVIAFAAGNAYAGLHKLRKEEALLEKQLESVTTQVFGRPVSAQEIQDSLLPKKEESPLPKLTAFDQMVEMSLKLPPKDQVKLDVSTLDIRPQKITFTATADSVPSIEEIEKRFRTIECFTDLQRGTVVGEQDKQFTLTIATKCM
jgi:Tfp pilus assembly PilM family ATPase